MIRDNLRRSVCELATAAGILGATAIGALRAAIASNPRVRAAFAESAFAGTAILNLRLRGELAELHRWLAEAMTTIERGAAEPAPCADREDGGEHHRCGACAYNAAHGAEAEELRKGIEEVLEHLWPGEARRRLQGLIDRVPARDSLAHLREHGGAQGSSS